jgi:hypothetical protein
VKQKLDHPILRKLIKVFAPGYNLSRNPCKKAERVQKLKDYELDENWIKENSRERTSEPDI